MDTVTAFKDYIIYEKRYSTRTAENYFDLNDEKELKQFVDYNPGGTVKLVDMEENEEENIYKLNDRVLIKDIPYDKFKKQNHG